MADQVLHIPVFGGGVVLEGAPDTQRTDELAACDGYDITRRGQLVAASDRADWLALRDTATVPVAPTRVLAIALWALPGLELFIVVGEGTDGATPDPRYFVWLAEREGATNPLPASHTKALPGIYNGAVTNAPPTPLAEGAIATVIAPPGQYKYVPPTLVIPPAYLMTRLAFVNIGAREGTAEQSGAGLYVLAFDELAAAATDIVVYASNGFDMLAKGRFGNAAAIAGGGPGAVAGNSYQMRFRGIAFYNGHVMGWGQGAGVDAGGGFSSVEEDGARLMFSNVETPLIFGNVDKPTTLMYSDTDAIVIGEPGEVIRAGVQYGRKFMIGTNRGLHYLEGYGRETFLTDRSTAIAASENVLGPHAMLVGPDGLLHGVGSKGHWTFNGSTFEQHYRKLCRFDGRSPGYWDLLWSDSARGTAYPGQTNCDLAWMVVDKTSMQVVIGIPWCDATSGYGYGTDTVVLKFHTETGGYTRQVFAGIQLTAADYVERSSKYRELALLGTSTAGQTSLQEYRRYATAQSSPPLPAALPSVMFGEYAEFGPDGVGVYQRAYLTLAWDAGNPAAPASALPLVFDLTPTVDNVSSNTVRLTIASVAPVLPNDGDTWVDTSGTDMNMGNGVPGAFFGASPNDFLVKRYVTSWAKWVPVPVGGGQGRRITVPIAFAPMRGTRLKVQCSTVSAAGRWQIEGFATKPTSVRGAQ